MYSLELDPITGYLIYSHIPLFHIKMIWFYTLGGLGALTSYVGRAIRGREPLSIGRGIFTFFIGVVSLYLVLGLVFLVVPSAANEPYVYFLTGYFNRDIYLWVETNTGRIVDRVLSKGVSKITGSEFKSEQTENQEQKKKDSSDDVQ